MVASKDRDPRAQGAHFHHPFQPAVESASPPRLLHMYSFGWRGGERSRPELASRNSNASAWAVMIAEKLQDRSQQNNNHQLQIIALSIQPTQDSKRD